MRQGISSDDFSTQNLNIQQEVNFRDGERIVVGQQASQQLEVKVRGFDVTGSTVGRLIDAAVSGVDGLQINGVNFDRENKEEAFGQARRAAFEDAKEKAEQLAELSRQRLGQVITITDVAERRIFPVFRSVSADVAQVSGTQVPPGDVEVGTNVEVVWYLGF